MLSLMSVVVLTIALVACGIAAVEHRDLLPSVLTGGFSGIMQLAQSVPWPAVFWTALFSTDLLLLIEVSHPALSARPGVTIHLRLVSRCF